MAGDMLNADSASPAVPVTLIEQLKDIAPVYYALGNHEIEYMEQTGEDLAEELTAAGAVVLDKAYVDLETEGVSIRLGGMYDYAFGTDRETGENLASAAPRHLGKPKTDALREQLLEIHPYLDIRTDTVKVTQDNVAELFAEDEIICEAFDVPENKAMLVNGIMEHFPVQCSVSDMHRRTMCR